MSASGFVASIPLKDIVISESNVRKTDIEKDIESLAENMRRHGLLQPIVVLKEGETYQLLIGQRRLLAAKRLGWAEIPAMIIGKLDPVKYTIISLSENIQRRELPYRDMVEACDKLYERYHNVNVIAEELGVSLQTVQNYLAHRLVPEPLKKMVEDKRISRKDALKVTTATMKSILEGDLEKPLRIAKEIAAMPKVQKTRVLETAQSNPDLPVRSIMEKSRKVPRRIKITLELPEKYKGGLEEAARDMDMDIDEVVKAAIIQWLKASGYA